MTLALELIKSQQTFYEFINADEIAKGLAPLTSRKYGINSE